MAHTDIDKSLYGDGEQAQAYIPLLEQSMIEEPIFLDEVLMKSEKNQGRTSSHQSRNKYETRINPSSYWQKVREIISITSGSKAEASARAGQG